MRRLPAVLAALFLCATVAAHANTFTTYDIAGKLAEGNFYGSFTVEVEQYNSPIVALDVFVTGPGAGVFDSGAPGSSFGSSASYAQVEFSNLFLFYLQVDPADGYALCTLLAPCGGEYTHEVDSALSNYQNPVAYATAPEPSSLVLLGTGLLGAAGFARRRFIKA